MKAPRPAPAPLTSPPRTRGEWMALYRHCRFATREDNAALLALAATPMRSGEVSVWYDRGDDYFAATEESAHMPLVVAFTQDDFVGVTTSLLVRYDTRFGEPTTFGYFADLRTTPKMTRRAWLEMARCYAEAVRYVPGIAEVDSPAFFVTTVLDGNERALRLFRERLPGLVYQPLQPYQVVHSLFSLWPPRRDRDVCIRGATVADVDAVRTFLASSERDSPLGEGIAVELPRRLQQWHGFSIESFLLAESPRGDVLGCVSPRRTPHRKTVFDGFGRSERLATRLLGRELRDGAPLDIVYLSHFAVGAALSVTMKQRVRRALLDAVNQGGAHALAWIEWPNFAETRVPTFGHVCVRTSGTLYQVVLREQLGDKTYDLSTEGWTHAPVLDVSTL